MRILFIVHGEGRGHLTQAIALSQLLKAADHEVIGAWVDVAAGRPVADFFQEQFSAPITPVIGPLLVYNSETNAFDLRGTLRLLLANLNQCWRSIRQLRDAIHHHQPDLVINFFELLGGLTYGLFRPQAPMVCIGHQCMAMHPVFPFPKGRWLDRLLFKALVRLNCWGATERFGLSFDEQPDVPSERLRVVPPLLRKELTKRMTFIDEPDIAPYIVAYTTQPGLLTQVLKAHRQCPDVPIHYFHAHAFQTQERLDHTLWFCRIDGPHYLEAMRHCQAVLTTAGFESVCEALYLGKPVLMMAQPNNYEQACNALDGERIGAGLADDRFDLNRLVHYAPNYDKRASIRFQIWYAKGEHVLLAALLRLVEARREVVNATSYHPFKPGTSWLQ